MIWVYAICERPEIPPPRRRGLAQAPLDAIASGRLLAVVSRHAHPPDEPALDALWVHERVVERLMEHGRAVLPMRFGTKLPDDGAVQEALRAREPELLAALDGVRGCVELSVRAMRAPDAPEPAAPAPLPARSGREYLLARLHDGRRAEHAAAELHEPLAALAVRSRLQPGRTAVEVLRAAYLVDRGAVARFRLAVDALQRSHPSTALLCTGPWPPYSFSELGAGTPAPVQA